MNQSQTSSKDLLSFPSTEGEITRTDPLSTRTWKRLSRMESDSWRLLHTELGSTERMAVQSMRYQHLKRALWLKLKELELEDEDW